MSKEIVGYIMTAVDGILPVLVGMAFVAILGLALKRTPRR